MTDQPAVDQDAVLAAWMRMRLSSEHPEWCDRSLCTGPDQEPDPRDGATVRAVHRSAPIDLPDAGWAPGGRAVERPVTAYLTEAVAGHRCETQLTLAFNGLPLLAVKFDEAARVLVDLVDLLRPAVAEYHTEFPILPVPGAQLYRDLAEPPAGAELDLDVAAAAARCNVDPAVWTAVHDAARCDPGGRQFPVRVTPHQGEAVVGYVAGVSDRDFYLTDGPALFRWRDVRAVALVRDQDPAAA